MLPHLVGRPATRKRWPDGVDELAFFEKDLPKSAPDWLARGTQITLLINGVLVNAIEEADITSGYVGVFAGTGDNDLTSVVFSHLTILDASTAAANWHVK